MARLVLNPYGQPHVCTRGRQAVAALRYGERPLADENLIDDPAARSLVDDMDKRLLSIMKETGDGWGIKAKSGDLKHWVPGGQSSSKPILAFPWPGCGITGHQGKRKKRKKNK